MGVFDDILGGDEKDKEKMRENIDRIRERVQERRRPGEPVEGGGPAPPVRASELEEEEREPEQRRPERGREQWERREEAPSRPPREQTRERQEQQRQEPMGEREAPEREPRRQREQPSRDRPEPEQQGPTREDVPEPPEVKDIDVPDIEKGPLFITVDKFRDALHAIADMRRVAADMDSYIGSMEGTLQEDRDTEEGIRRILDEAEDDTAKLQDIVSP